jgi:hypothetical protein
MTLTESLPDIRWQETWGLALTDRPQAFAGLPRAAYDQLSGWNASTLKTVALKTEAHAWQEHLNPDRVIEQDQGAFLVGNITHTSLLEPELFDERYLELPPGAPGQPTAKQLEEPKPRKDGTVNTETKVYATWLEAKERQAWWDRFREDHRQLATAQLVPASELALGTACATAVRSHPAVGPLFADAPLHRRANELTLTWLDPVLKVRCKARLDALRFLGDRLWVGDLKTAINAAPGPDGFARDAERFGYLLSATWYLDGARYCREPIEQLLDLPEGTLITAPGGYTFEWIAIEKARPRPEFVGRYLLTDEQQEAARPVIRRAFERAVQAEASGWWAGYDTAAKPLELAPYGYTRLARLAEALA